MDHVPDDFCDHYPCSHRRCFCGKNKIFSRPHLQWTLVGSCILSGLLLGMGRWLVGPKGVIDFAGGIVVHATAGASALTLAYMLGRRQGFPWP